MIDDSGWLPRFDRLLAPGGRGFLSISDNHDSQREVVAYTGAMPSRHHQLI
jgi:hypothetical protein